jgi:hypothetical protein
MANRTRRATPFPVRPHPPVVPWMRAVTNDLQGPRPFTCSGSSGSGPSGGGSGATAALYGQCGGGGWTGPTTCASGTCKASNQWYSKLPLLNILVYRHDLLIDDRSVLAVRRWGKVRGNESLQQGLGLWLACVQGPSRGPRFELSPVADLHKPCIPMSLGQFIHEQMQREFTMVPMRILYDTQT